LMPLARGVLDVHPNAGILDEASDTRYLQRVMGSPRITESAHATTAHPGYFCREFTVCLNEPLVFLDQAARLLSWEKRSAGKNRLQRRKGPQ
jgi:hypothetical protein